jgi:hypothetical protein
LNTRLPGYEPSLLPVEYPAAPSMGIEPTSFLADNQAATPVAFEGMIIRGRDRNRTCWALQP